MHFFQPEPLYNPKELRLITVPSSINWDKKAVEAFSLLRSMRDATYSSTGTQVEDSWLATAARTAQNALEISEVPVMDLLLADVSLPPRRSASPTMSEAASLLDVLPAELSPAPSLSTFTSSPLTPESKFPLHMLFYLGFYAAALSYFNFV